MAEMRQDWLFDADRKAAAQACYREAGFVGFRDLIEPETLAATIAAVDRAVADGALAASADVMAANNDVIFVDPAFEALCRHPRIVATARALLGHPIELQHAKFNAKPLGDTGGGQLPWHQDYPYFPHTNFDLVACAIHLDLQEADNGPIRVIPGSHRWGALSHSRDGRFANQCTDPRDFDACPSRLLVGARGMVTFHHALTLHRSDWNRAGRHRRLMIFQYRAQDAVQFAGVVWRCNGFAVEDRVTPRRARFPDGTTVEMRGDDGRLYDPYHRFAPDR